MNKLQVYNLFKKPRKTIDGGLLFSVEGIDGSGKGTNVKNLESYLLSEGYKVKRIGFPQYEKPIGKVIASYLKGEYGSVQSVPHELICIAYAADRAEMKDEIKNYLANGYIVLSDRYTYSNLFTAAKMEKEKRTHFIEWIENIEFKEMKVVKPDYNFFLYVDPQISIQRIEERGKREYQNGKEDIHENNSKLLIDTTETYLDFTASKDNWIVIDQMKDGKQISQDEVFQLLKSKVNDILSEYDKF